VKVDRRTALCSPLLGLLETKPHRRQLRFGVFGGSLENHYNQEFLEWCELNPQQRVLMEWRDTDGRRHQQFITHREADVHTGMDTLEFERSHRGDDAFWIYSRSDGADGSALVWLRNKGE